jgi:enediyne polyketide synthase
MTEIAIVGMSCRYADSRSPQELWENVLSQRQAFRRFPAERLRIEDYFCQDASVPDTTYATQGAFIDNYEFDRVRFRISGNSYRTSDLAHWLALDIASQALADAGFKGQEDMPSNSTSVIVGNTLTGEFSRANGLRLRWPYVRRVVEAALRQEGWMDDQLQLFLKKLELTYKEPFTPVGEETLAGGLSNTIAGRICNYFNLKGGGYTVDGACASSLLAIATASASLASGEVDLALAGGVDLSLDPFELVGFAKTSALTAQEMRVYDQRSSGFIPGEGCGFVVLMRYEDALAQQRRVYALVKGWGISSDGSGGITRPEVEGQMLALKRAYQKAGLGIEGVTYFEGHGTGTSVGDVTELQTLLRARKHTQEQVPPATLGSIKANIGHTKAAAGAASFIKATMALSTQLIPPITGTGQPHPELLADSSTLAVRDTGMIWPAERPLWAGVSSMGFGGINVHLVLEGISSQRRTALTRRERSLLSSSQDAELILLAAQDTTAMQWQVAHLLTLAHRLSLAEVTDLAMHLAQKLEAGSVRAAIVASNPVELTQRLAYLQTLLEDGVESALEVNKGVFLGQGVCYPRIGFLFPGQGSPGHLQGGLIRRRFDFVDDLYVQANLPTAGDEKDTSIAQPAIVTSSLAALRTLQRLGVTAELSVGHSLGELSALHWAGAFDECTLIQLARVRGHAMGTLGSPTGMMVSILASQEVVEELIQGTGVVIAGFNAPQQIVVSGEVAEIADIIARARIRGLHVIPLKVSHAFHSPLVAAAVPSFAQHLAEVAQQPLQRLVISTVTGLPVEPDTPLKDLLCQQITAPVQFVSSVQQAATQVDLFIEVGPGSTLSGLAAKCATVPAIATESGGSSLRGLFHAIGAAFALGAPLNLQPLWEGRFYRSFDLNWQPRFFSNPCEQAPLPGAEVIFTRAENPMLPEKDSSIEHTPADGRVPSLVDLIRRAIAERAELPVEAISDSSRMLSDLHLNSITVGQIVSETARSLGILPPSAPTEYADATVAEIAQVLEELKQSGGSLELQERMKVPAGVDSWIRTFQVQYLEKSLPVRPLLVTEQSESAWHVLTPSNYPLAAALSKACAGLAGAGVLVCLPPQPQNEHIALLLQGVHEVLERGEGCSFVLLQHGGGGASVARTLYLEASKHRVCVVDVPVNHPQTVEWVCAEIQTAHGYTEVVYDEQGTRRIPTLQPFLLSQECSAPLSLDTQDVLLVTGGGKGIAAECALSLALASGVRLALLGRSRAADDRELAENLQRFAEAEIDFCYLSVDVTQEAAVRQAVGEIEQKLGPITAILHGAGANTPRLLRTLNEADIAQTVAPKVQGLQHILAAIDPQKLRLLVTFGSVIARTGMRGEADYALANDWLAAMTESFQGQYPACRCVCLEWSIWAGVGMGERLGRVEALMREGITPITVDQGVTYFQHILNHRLPQARMVVTSRFGNMPTLRMTTPKLPMLRFLEQPRIYYPGIELVVDVEVATATDFYLDDHRYRGERLMPAVVGLEAMAQVAMAVTGQDRLPSFEQVQLERPIVISERTPLKIRLAALASESGKIIVVVRSEETAFQVDHFRATCRFDQSTLEKLGHLADLPEVGQAPDWQIQLDPARDLYGSMLFHQGRFQRLGGYAHLRATACVAQITPYTEGNLFAHYMPSELVLGDFIARDAVIHAIQPCIPHARLLPIAVERITFAPGSPGAEQVHFVYARERARVGDTFTYDVEVRTAEGELTEQWLGLQLRQVEELKLKEPCNVALLSVYMERKLAEFYPNAFIRLIVERSADHQRQARSDQAFRHLLGPTQSVRRRPDGKPTVAERSALDVSASHHEHLTLATASSRAVGCDIEPVAARPPALWQDLLGSERSQLAAFLTAQTGEDIHAASTRLWTAAECLKKAGAMVNAPLRFAAQKGGNWILLKAGPLLVATYITGIVGEEGRMAFAICSSVE